MFFFHCDALSNDEESQLGNEQIRPIAQAISGRRTFVILVKTQKHNMMMHSYRVSARGGRRLLSSEVARTAISNDISQVYLLLLHILSSKASINAGIFCLGCERS